MYQGKLADPEFRTERARQASAKGNGAQGVLTRFMHLLERNGFTDTQIETVRRALPPVIADGGN